MDLGCNLRFSEMVSPEFAVFEVSSCYNSLVAFSSPKVYPPGLELSVGTVSSASKATLAGASAFVDCQRPSLLPHIQYGHGGPIRLFNPEDRTRHSHLRFCAMG